MSETLQERVMKAMWEERHKVVNPDYEAMTQAVFKEIKAAGYRIVKPHDYRPDPGWPYSGRTSRLKCANCGAFEDGLAAGLGCEVI